MKGMEAMKGIKTIKGIEGMQGVSCYPGNLFYRFHPCDRGRTCRPRR